jgi:mannose-6-phosphate isomerase
MGESTFNHLASQPLFLNPNRVRRTYTGGMKIEELQGNLLPKDGGCPEEWVASVIEARNPGFEKLKNEGLSTVSLINGDRVFLKDIIHSGPELFLGQSHIKKYGENLGVLIKLIDSLERLTIQVHPNKKFAKEVFHSEFGKTEAWYVIGERMENNEEPYLFLGFKQSITRQLWSDIFYRQDIPAMMECLHKVKPLPGDVFLVEGGVPHAIGPGCFLIEIQEPTDFTLRTEKTTPLGKDIPAELVHQGVGLDKLFDCFHYQGLTFKQTMEKWKIRPQVTRNDSGGSERELIGEKNTKCFSMNEIAVNDKYECGRDGAFSMLFVLSGHGIIRWDDKSKEIGPSDEIFLPYSLNSFILQKTGDVPLKLIRCFPPK